jgi:ligand-binding SRPBCC domain-containing protein
MAELSQSVKIEAPVQKVFAFVTNPANWTKFVTSLVDVSELSPEMPQAGATFAWEYKMLGLRFSGQGRVTEYEKDRSFAISMSGRFPITETYHFMPRGQGTELTVKIHYEVPEGIIGQIADKVLLERLNALEARNVLEKIKLLCEAL